MMDIIFFWKKGGIVNYGENIFLEKGGIENYGENIFLKTKWGI